MEEVVAATATEVEVSMTAVVVMAGFDAEEMMTALGLVKADAPCLR